MWRGMNGTVINRANTVCASLTNRLLQSANSAPLHAVCLARVPLLQQHVHATCTTMLQIRYFILHAFGGLYLDLDIECWRGGEPWLLNADVVLQVQAGHLMQCGSCLMMNVMHCPAVCSAACLPSAAAALFDLVVICNASSTIACCACLNCPSCGAGPCCAGYGARGHKRRDGGGGRWVLGGPALKALAWCCHNEPTPLNPNSTATFLPSLQVTRFGRPPFSACTATGSVTRRWLVARQG